MCDKCVELDEKAAHYRQLAARVTDRLALDGIATLLAELQARKADLHPEPKNAE